MIFETEVESRKNIVRRDISNLFRKYIGRQVSYYTHGIHRYPAKFIPQVPRFCMEGYSKPGDVLLDPFMGSGTTLLEAKLNGRDAFGIDIHPLARLITKVKITPLDISNLKSTSEELIDEIKNDSEDNPDWIPKIPNFEHWFRDDVARDLATIKKHICNLPEGDERDLFKICFSSIIRKVSNSDDDSLIPEVTSFQKKLVEQGKADFDSVSRFENAVRLRLLDVKDLNHALEKSRRKYKRESRTEIIGNDAREIALKDGSIYMGITSPPYASAVHYVSVHKLEMYWLDMFDKDNSLDKKIVGTVRVHKDEYGTWEPGGLHPSVDELVSKMARDDKKIGYIVHKYFQDMLQNLQEMHRCLDNRGRYCIVAGENVLRRTRIPTYKLLDQLARKVGFEREAIFSYDIINRHLDVPRWNNSAIAQDHILIFTK